MRLYYESRRHASNTEYHKAGNCAMVLLANHVLSALDAVWSVKRANRKIESGLRVQLKPIRETVTPFYTLQLRW